MAVKLSVVPQRPSRSKHIPYRELCFCCLGKHSQTETGFKTNFLPMKGENSIISCCVVLTFQSAEIEWLFKETVVF